MKAPDKRKQFVRFATIGAIGFLIEAFVLTALSQGFALNLYLSRLVSFSCACTATWLLNRTFTFSHATRGVDIHSAEYVRYLTVQVCGALLNLAVFSALIAAVPKLHQAPVLPLAVGAVFGLAFNFVGARLWVYPDKGRSLD